MEFLALQQFSFIVRSIAIDCSCSSVFFLFCFGSSLCMSNKVVPICLVHFILICLLYLLQSLLFYLKFTMFFFLPSVLVYTQKAFLVEACKHLYMNSKLRDTWIVIKTAHCIKRSRRRRAYCRRSWAAAVVVVVVSLCGSVSRAAAFAFKLPIFTWFYIDTLDGKIVCKVKHHEPSITDAIIHTHTRI